MTVAIVRHFENLRTLLKASTLIIDSGNWTFNESYTMPTIPDTTSTQNYLLSLFRVPQAIEAGIMSILLSLI